MRYLILLLLASCATAPLPTTKPVVLPPEQALVYISSLGSNVEDAYVQKAVAYINKAYSDGCIEKGFASYKFKSLHNIDGKQVKTAKEAYDRYVANAPYGLDVRWYSKRLTSTVGYTYNYYDGASSGDSETRIFTNMRRIASEKDLADHYAHELSHQARAGAFVHYTTHEGSVPYGINDIVADCIKAY